MKFSTLPFLLATVLMFIAMITRRAVKLDYIQPQNAKNVYYLLGILGLWTVVSSILAIKGFYASPRYF